MARALFLVLLQYFPYIMTEMRAKVLEIRNQYSYYV